MFNIDAELVGVYKYLSVYERSYLIQSPKCSSRKYLTK